jgi:hypothetical protein
MKVELLLRTQEWFQQWKANVNVLLSSVASKFVGVIRACAPRAACVCVGGGESAVRWHT